MAAPRRVIEVAISEEERSELERLARALLAEPVAAMPVYVSHLDVAAVGLQPTKVVTYAGAARQSPPQLLLSPATQVLAPRLPVV